jgi:hypothetical protein
MYDCGLLDCEDRILPLRVLPGRWRQRLSHETHMFPKPEDPSLHPCRREELIYRPLWCICVNYNSR